MPFNNLSTVVKISGNKVQELFQYLNNNNKQHPVSGLKIIFNQKKIQNALIQNKKFNINKSYYVLTSNFLQEGGDKMDFFINPLELYNLETNIREVLIKHITMKKKIEGKFQLSIYDNEGKKKFSSPISINNKKLKILFFELDFSKLF